MAEALRQAGKAERCGDVPVGCVITRNGKIVAAGRNQRERKQDATAHAEIIAIRRACRKLRSWRLCDCEMWVTLEPCLMCIGAILNARIRRVIIGAPATVSNLELFTKNNLNWKTETELTNNAECRKILIDFFGQKR